MPTPTFPLARLGHLRTALHACFTRRADALFELGDALLCAPSVPWLPHLSLEAVCRRGWGSAYAALARGQVDAERLRDLLVAREPATQLILQCEAIDQALAAMGDFADLLSPYLVGHSAGVAELAAAAAHRCGLAAADLVAVRQAALVHDLGRVAVPARIWQKAAPLTPDEWEQVRLRAYHTERILCRSPFLAALAPAATAHHERLDGAGYHRRATAVDLRPPARLLAAADAYHAMTEPRPYRETLSPQRAADALGQQARDGRLDADSVAAVLEAAGHAAPRVTRPAGLADREAQVVALLARGLQPKQIARALGISAKTADRHVQNTYGKIGISTKAAAALFAMEHGLATWGEVPIVSPPAASSVLTQAPGAEIRCSSGGGGNEDHAPCAKARTEPRRWHP
jgi:HD-GYP domain-containing protein (c-di-GMP phosphodiesterase class II)